MSLEALKLRMAVYGALVDQYADTLARMEELKKEIQQGVKEYGQTLKHDGVTATFRNPYVRTSWDNKGLEGYALHDPKVLTFRKQTDVGASVAVKVESR